MESKLIEMRVFILDGTGKTAITQMSIPQSKQSIAIADCIGRLIPQEGVDYDIEVTFKGRNDPSVSMGIIPHTDKGEWWRKYVLEMINKYPPTVHNPEQSIPEDSGRQEREDA